MRYQLELNQVKWEKSMKMQTAMHCAPVFAGVKPSNAVTLNYKDSCELLEALKDTEIQCELIYADSLKCLWLLYREEEIKTYLMRKEHLKFLKNCGYSSFHLKDILHTLRKRYHQYKNDQKEFPHEIGLILGYPLCDVEGFIRYHGKNCLYSGYWKVYGNLSNTKKLFDIYDLVRYQMIKQVEYGKSLKQIMESYKNYQVPSYA